MSSSVMAWTASAASTPGLKRSQPADSITSPAQAASSWSSTWTTSSPELITPLTA